MRIERLSASEIEPYIGEALDRETGELSDVMQEIERGVSEAWRITEGDALACMVTRIEGAELVVVALQGRGLRELAPRVIEQAERVGCRSVRYHTQHGRISEILSEFGFIEAERVYRVRLNGR